MQETSTLYQDLLASPNHWTETRLAIGENGRLITKQAERITFGGVGILIGASGADSGYDEALLRSMSIENNLFSSNTPSVGCCVAGEIDVEMLKPIADIPRRARLAPYVRITDGKQYSEWIQKGVFYIDTREYSANGEERWATFHGFDAMLFAEADYPDSTLEWPAKDIDVVKEIANAIEVQIDSRTLKIMTRGYQISSYPIGYSMREVLGFIASFYSGCFIMNDLGELRLVRLGDLPKDTRYLVVSTTDRRAITFGGDRILV